MGVGGTGFAQEQAQRVDVRGDLILGLRHRCLGRRQLRLFLGDIQLVREARRGTLLRETQQLARGANVVDGDLQQGLRVPQLDVIAGDLGDRLNERASAVDLGGFDVRVAGLDLAPDLPP
jgi:hypothetical protein